MASADKSRRLRRRSKRSEAYRNLCKIAPSCDKFLKARGLSRERDFHPRKNL
jgi:hypothetical protein